MGARALLCLARSAPNPGERTPGLGSAKSITQRRPQGDSDAAAGSGTMGRRGKTSSMQHPVACRVSPADQRRLSGGAGARRPGLPRQRPGAGAGPRRLRSGAALI